MEINPNPDTTVTLNPTDTDPWVQSYTFSVYTGYTFSGVFSVAGSLVADGIFDQVPTEQKFGLTTGSTTLSITYLQVTLATVAPGIVTIVQYPTLKPDLIGEEFSCR